MTTIEWTRNDDGTEGKSWNPVRGCSRVSAGCDHCYAMGQAHRFSGPGKPFEGLTTIRRGKVDWIGRARFVPEMLAAPLRWKKPQRIFVNSMSDLFHESLSDEEIAAVFGVMAACPRHTFQVLTKRPKRAAEWFKWITEVSQQLPGLVGEECPPTSSLEGSACLMTAGLMIGRPIGSVRAYENAPWPLPNVWLGVSVEDQATAEERIPLLLELPAAVRFVSAEPLLGPVDLNIAAFTGAESFSVMGRLDWVIAGGESGPGARPCALEWLEALVADCRGAGVACFVKQLGARPYQVVDGEARVNGTTIPWAKIVAGDDSRVMSWIGLNDKKGGDMSEWPESLRVREFPGALATPHQGRGGK